MSTLGDIEVDEGAEVHDAEGGAAVEVEAVGAATLAVEAEIQTARVSTPFSSSRGKMRHGESFTTLLPRRLLGAWTSAS